MQLQCLSAAIRNQATAGDALSRDVLASVLLRLPASDLRRFRRVCKEWCDVISNPVFINEHTVHGPRTMTRTIVFFPGNNKVYDAEDSDGGSGFLFDEQWRLTATFTAGNRSEDMIGTCNGLLCFLDHGQGSITVVEPFTGESLALPPPPPETKHRDEPSTYCFGLDHGSRRYKIVHGGFHFRRDDARKQELHVYTVGGGEGWRGVRVAGAADHELVCGPMYADGVVYWSMRGEHGATKLARLDLATEEVAWGSVQSRRLSDLTPELDMTAGSDMRVCVMTTWRHIYWTALFVGQGGHWVRHSVGLPPGRRASLRQPLQRGHLLLEDYGDAGLYVHPISPARDGLGSGRLLLARGEEEELPKISSFSQAPFNRKLAKSTSSSKQGDKTPRCNTRGLFIAVPFNQAQAATAGRVSHEQGVSRTFCYAPTVSPAPLARYFGKL